ncbi:ABC-type lipoprotein release transport system permease subunit [Ruminiclostridium sufflavum DSM 19573]|uniref:ABC-type lipoprotein release transport system permease subunit n=1 Tax=Ruminiclostridium sufflavum DSM 19573 TaxID=1121337 RepID=A0A318XME5_9FIRM|nr:ABC transporter permease [Ruminiclostridium sufflavum]PYG88701.1 ABC-type lipoprotein release transport system permease subunit [Ruminiclostridium sufflavum DSM 19573]
MRNFDILLMGLKNLFRRKTRTILTVLGVVIGTASIVVMVSLGMGMNESFEAQLKQMGNLNIINVTTYRNDPDSSGGPQKEIVLDDAAITKISKIEGIKGITPVIESSMKLISGKYMAYVQVMGIDVKSMPNFDYPIAEGRLLQEGDSDKIVVGGNIPQYFYNPKSRYGSVDGQPAVNVLTDKIEATFDMSYGEKQQQQGLGGSDTSDKAPKLYKLKAVGVLDITNDWQKDQYIFMDYLNLKKLMKDAAKAQNGQSQSSMMFDTNSIGKSFDRLMVMVDKIKDVDRIQSEIDDLGYGTNSLADMRKSMQKQSQTIQLVLGAIGAISLIISALGITNTMIMSIYERTREIGVMKVLGCKMGNIRHLFLLEAGIIGLLGGCIGVILSYLASFALNTIGKSFMNSESGGMLSMGMGMGMGDAESRISVIPIWLALTSIAFAIFIGLVSGFSPARRAMKLSALEAIKSE